jgi:hypothetical protein
MNNKNLYLQKFSNESLSMVNMQKHMTKLAFLSTFTGVNKEDINSLKEWGELLKKTGVNPNELKNIFNEFKESGIGLNEIREYIKDFKSIKDATNELGGMKNVAKYLKDAGHMAKKYNEFKPYLPYVGGIGLGALGGGIFGGTGGAIFGGLGTGLLMYLLRDYIFKKNNTNNTNNTNTAVTTDQSTATNDSTKNKVNDQNPNAQTSKVINNVPKDNNNSIIVNEKGSTTAAPKATNTATSTTNPVTTTNNTATSTTNPVTTTEDKSKVDQKENQINLSKTNYPYNSVIKQKTASTESSSKIKFNPSKFEGPRYTFDALKNVSDPNDDHKITFKRLVNTGKTSSNEPVNVYKYVQKPLSKMFDEEGDKLRSKIDNLNKNMSVLDYLKYWNNDSDINDLRERRNKSDKELEVMKNTFSKLKESDNPRKYWSTLFDLEDLENRNKELKDSLKSREDTQNYKLNRFKQITGKDWNSLDEETKKKIIDKYEYMEDYYNYLNNKEMENELYKSKIDDLDREILYKTYFKEKRNKDGKLEFKFSK